MKHNRPAPGPYNQGPYAPGPYAPMPPRPPRRRAGAKVAIGVGIAFALFVIFVAIGANASDAEHAAQTSASTAPDPADKTAAPAEDKDKKEPATEEYGDGDHIIGEDIPPGTYQTTGAESGLVEFCQITTEPTSDAIPKWKTANKDERIIIKLTEDDHLVTINGCAPLTPRK